MPRSMSINAVMNGYNDLLQASNDLQKENFYLKQEIEKLKVKGNIFKISRSFPEDIDNVICQQGPKYLLLSMKEVSNIHGFFTRELLIDWMIKNKDNEEYLSFNKNVTSNNNIKKYWNLAHNKNHNARILEFKEYYV